VGGPGRGGAAALGAGGLELGAELLELGPGPGITTEVLRRRVARVTAVELDAALASRLARRLRGSGVRVVRGDGAALPFHDRSFDAAAVFTMLHHVPSEALQDRLLAEVCRCLRPGGLLVGSDTLPSLRFRLYHLADTMVAVDPDRLPARLEAAGFDGPLVDTRAGGSASAPAARTVRRRGRPSGWWGRRAGRRPCPRWRSSRSPRHSRGRPSPAPS
jgi:SAM-dependent methyltransferase